MKLETIKKEGYNLHLLKTKSCKTILIKAIFWEPIKKEDLTIRNMLMNNLLFSCNKYKTGKEMEIKLEELYGAYIGGGNYRRGNYIISEFGLSVIEDKYSEKGTVKEAINFFFEIISNPNVKNGKFNEENFNINYESIKSDIKMSNENPLNYSIKEYKKLLGKDKAFTYQIEGTLEELEKITPQNLYDYYKKFLKTNNIDIFITGNINEEIINCFSDLKHKKNEISDKNIYINYEKEYSEKIIKTDFAQSKLILGASTRKLTDKEKKYAALIFNIIFGNSPNSKIFKNVREKNSFAYSISSSINRLDGIFIIHAGISKENYEKTLNEIKKSFQEMKNGKFSNRDLNNAKAVILSLIKEINDYQSAIIDHAFNNLYLDADNIEKQKEEVKKITKEDVIKVANKINIDTILLVEEKNEKNTNK